MAEVDNTTNVEAEVSKTDAETTKETEGDTKETVEKNSNNPISNDEKQNVTTDANAQNDDEKNSAEKDVNNSNNNNNDSNTKEIDEGNKKEEQTDDTSNEEEDKKVEEMKAKIKTKTKKDSLSGIMGAFSGSSSKKSGGMMGAFGGLKKNAAEKKEPVEEKKEIDNKNNDTDNNLNNTMSSIGQYGSNYLPDTPQSAAVSGLFSREGGLSMEPSTSGMSSIGQDVDALSTLLDSMYEQDRRAAMSKRKEPMTGNGARPYLDVMTVNTTQYPSAMDGDTFGTHTRLLIEPISFPSLKHTGVNSELLDKVADEKELPNMFYPNGTRKLSLRNSIRGLLRVEPSRIGMNSLSNISIDQMSSNWGGNTQKSTFSSGGSTLNSIRNTSKMSTRKYKARRSKRNKMMRKSASASFAQTRSRQRIGSRTRLRSRETRDVLDALHETLHFMDRAVMKA